MRKQVDRYTFYSGLMLGLAALRTEFTAEGDAFYEAFLATVRLATEADHDVEGARWMKVDPVFGVVHEANEMLLEAEHDRLLSLMNPALRTARFRITQNLAKSELEGLDDGEWYLRLAKEFDNLLSR